MLYDISIFWPIGKGDQPMVAVVIFTDKGEAYCMGQSSRAVVDCVQAVNEKGRKAIHYIGDAEKRVKYIARAFEQIEQGGGGRE